MQHNRWVCVLLFACGTNASPGDDPMGQDLPSPTPYTVSGEVRGLAGTGLVLQMGQQTLAVSSNGAFSFPQQVLSTPAITVAEQPKRLSQTCTVSGTDITCVTNHFLVRGLVADYTTPFTVSDGTTTATAASGAFAFDYIDGSTATLTISEQPADGECRFLHNVATLDGADATVDLLCVQQVLPRDNIRADWARTWVNRAGNACGNETGHLACLPAGPRRAVNVYGTTDCTNASAADALGAFTWFCERKDNHARFVSNHLNPSVYLSSLIDFDANAFKANSVTLSLQGDTYDTASAVWWPDAFDTLDADCLGASTVGVHLLKQNCTFSGALATNGVLVVKPGAVIDLNGVIAYSVRDWFEGALDGTHDTSGANSVLQVQNLTIVDHVTADNFPRTVLDSNVNRLTLVRDLSVPHMRAEDTAVSLVSNNQIVDGVTVGHSQLTGVQIASANGVIRNVHTHDNTAQFAGYPNGVELAALGTVVIQLSTDTNQRDAMDGFIVGGTVIGASVLGSNERALDLQTTSPGGHVFNAMFQGDAYVDQPDVHLGGVIATNYVFAGTGPYTAVGPVLGSGCTGSTSFCSQVVDQASFTVDVPNETFIHTWRSNGATDVLKAADCALLGGLSAGAGDSFSCTAEALAYSVEIMWDEVGNDNGLCESHERCEVFHLAGVSQGTGPLLPLDVVSAGGLVDMALFDR